MKRIKPLLLSLVTALLSLSSAVTAKGIKPHRDLTLGWAREPLLLVENFTKPVKRVKSNCDCFTARITGDQRMQVQLTVDSRVFGEDSTRELHVYFTDGTRATLPYHFRVPVALQLSSKALIWQRGAAPSPQTLTLRIPQGSPISKLVDAGLDKESFTIATQTVRAGREYRITATPKQTRSKQLVRLIITTDSPHAHERRHLVYLRVK